MLLANNLAYQIDGREIFRDLSLSLASGNIIHLKGHNGVGKTTLIEILINMIKPKHGDIFWEGKNINKDSRNLYKNLTYIMDHPTSKKDLTMKENINYWIKLFSSNIKPTEINNILKLLSIDNYINIPINYLSSGEIKKFELLRLIIEKKKLWILDEPYSGLDNTTIELINETFKNHIENNGMIIFSSHYYPEIRTIETINLEEYANK